MTSDSATGRCFEIEITPEMIAAASLALAGWDDRFTPRKEAAEEIIRAALDARSPMGSA